MQQQPPRGQFQGQRPVMVMPQPPQPKRRFRWSLIVVPGAVLLAIYVVRAVGTALSAFSWNDFLDRLGIVHKDRFSAIALMMCACLAIVALAKILGWGSKEE
jgi:formate hydrogenlyase subunit 3/multisubunit Na+/H+ antiporter MnhD subunit